MQLRFLCKSKIHHATVTQADLHYVGSIGIDATLMRMADILPHERVSVWNVNNGERIETYALPLPADSGTIVANGAAARHFMRGDRIIIVAFALADEPIEPKMLVVDGDNRFLSWLPGEFSDEGVEETAPSLSGRGPG
jgi:aspartate 1-decarboxylase